MSFGELASFLKKGIFSGGRQVTWHNFWQVCEVAVETQKVNKTKVTWLSQRSICPGLNDILGRMQRKG